MRFYPAAALKAAGANVSNGPNWAPHIEEDRELLTGQQPFSDRFFAEALVKKLNAAVGAQR